MHLSVVLLTAIASLVFSAAGVWLSGVQGASRKVVPFAGAMLVAMSLFWVLPELATELGWAMGSSLLLAGAIALWGIDRYLYPVCPACSHTHDHDSCSTRLHGFATPLIGAAVVHSLFDGWTMAAGETFGSSLSWTVIVHKLPESIAFGVILRAALRSRAGALLWASLAQAAMIAGFAIERVAAPYLGARWILLLLAFGGGTFLYLGVHAIHSEWKRRLAMTADGGGASPSASGTLGR